jgi:hypothetical protein
VNTFFRNELLGTFAEKYALRVQKDESGDLVIAGRQGQIYEYGTTELGLAIIPQGDPRPRLWNSVLKECLEVGMILRQRGDAEGALSFDPTNPKQARVAIRAAKSRPKRLLSEEQRLRLAKSLERARENRKNSVRNGTSGAFLSSEQTGLGETTSVSNIQPKTPSLTEISSSRAEERSW